VSPQGWTISLEQYGENSGTVAGFVTASRLGGGKRLVHDASDRSRTTPALGAAAETVIDLAGRARHGLAWRECPSHVVIGKYVAGADDHHYPAKRQLVLSETIHNAARQRLQKKNVFLKQF
jgi:hypothetical protein